MTTVTAKKVLLKDEFGNPIIPYTLPTSYIGQIIQVNANENYVPEGTLPCDGTEYSKAQFSDLWDNYLTGELETISTFVPIEGITKNGKSYVFNRATLGSGELDFNFNFITADDITTKQTLFELNGNAIVLERGVLNYEGSLDENNDEFSSYSLTENTEYNVRVMADELGFVVLINGEQILGINSYLITFIASSSFKGSFDLSKGFYEATGIGRASLGETITETKMKTLLNTCDYSEYETELTTYGQCAKFAVDVDNETFRVPTIIGKLVNSINKATVLYDMQTTNDMKIRVPLADSLGRINMLFNATNNSDNSEGVTSANNSDNFGQVKYTGTSYKTSDLPSGGTTGSVTPSVINFDPNGTLYVDNEDLEQSIEVRYFVVVANGQTNQSMMDWSAWASSLQGKANNDLSNCTKPYIVEMSDKSLLPSWYKIYSNGWCEQGGQSAVATATTTITLLKSYSNANYSLSLTGSTGYPWVTSRTTSSFVADTSAAATVDWEAKGYIN